MKLNFKRYSILFFVILIIGLVSCRDLLGDISTLFVTDENNVGYSPAFQRHLDQTDMKMTGVAENNNLTDQLSIYNQALKTLSFGFLVGRPTQPDKRLGTAYAEWYGSSDCSSDCGSSDCGSSDFSSSDCGSSDCSSSDCNTSDCGSSDCSGGDPAAGPVAEADDDVDEAEDAVEDAQGPEDQQNVTDANDTAEQAGEDQETAQENTAAAEDATGDTVADETGSQDQTDETTGEDNAPDTGADPVKIATGDFTTGETDLQYASGNFKIKIARNYLSSRNSSHSFGAGWNFNYDTRIIMGVKPNAAAERDTLRSLANNTYALYQNALQEYNNSLAKINITYNEAVAARQTADGAVASAQQAYDTAQAYNSPLLSRAQGLLNEARSLQQSALAWEQTVSQARQALLNSYSKITGIHNEYLKIKAMADQSALEAKRADSNVARNLYTVNASDPRNLQYTGNNTLTLIDEAGVPHLYTAETAPDYQSSLKYPNGQPNYFPQGATWTSSLPTDDRVKLLPDGSYRLTKKDKTHYLYSFYGQLSEIVDPNGNRLSFRYSTTHELTGIVDDYGKTLSFTRQNGKITKITDPKGREYRYTYNAKGLLSSRTDADGATVGYEYDENLLTTSVKPDKSSYEFHYKNLNGRKVVDYTEDEEGNRETFSYFPGGMYSEYTTASGILERHYYNDRYLETRIEYPDGSFVGMDYDGNNNLISYRNELGYVFQYGYDQNRNLIQAAGPEGKMESWTYNEFNKVKSYTDKMGNTTWFSYDNKGNLLAVNYPDGSGVTYVYNLRGQVTEAVDQLGNKTIYGYDRYGYLATVTDPAGKNKSFENDPAGNIIKYTDEAGFVTRYEYNGDNKISKIIDPLGNAESYSYNNRKDLVRVVDKNGNATAMEYDRRHLLVKVVNPLGESVEYKYQDDQKLAEKVVNGLSRTVYTYDRRGNPASETQVETGVVTTYAYNPAGQLTAVIDPNGNRTEYTYDALGSVTKVKDPAGNLKSLTYNDNQKVTSVTDERGNITCFDYDRMNRLVTVTDPKGKIIRYNYDLKGNLTGVTDKKGNITQYKYNKLDRLVKITDPLDKQELLKYDPRGLIAGKTDKNGNTAAYEYDSLRRLSKATDPLGGIRQYTYDPMGNLTSRTDENGVVTNFTYDALNRLTAETDAKGNRTGYLYNHLDQVVKKTDALNNETAFDYDRLGQLVKVTDAIGATKAYEYDKNGNVIKVMDELSNHKTYKYDGLNRLVEAVDELNQTIKYQYDPKGNLAQVTDAGGGVLRYEYDSLDRLVKEVNLLGKAKEYAYDPNGNLTAQADFSGDRTTYKYDKLNRLTETVFPDGKRKEFNYDPVGNLTQAANDTVTGQYIYDPLSRLTKARTVGLIEDEVKLADFTYDKAGFITSITTSDKVAGSRKANDFNGSNQFFDDGLLAGRSDAGNSGPCKVTYRYDDLNQLERVNLPDGAKVEFKYDALNRVAERVNSNGTGILYSYTPRGEVESIINYSGQGRDRVIGSYGYLYNAKGQRIYQLEDDGDLTAYAYDPAGRVKEVYYPFEDKKKVEDLKERADYGLLTECNEPCKFTLNIPDLSWDELENLNSQIKELNNSFNSHFKKKFNQGNLKEVQLTRGPNSLKFSNHLNPDHQNRNKLDNLFRKIREGGGYLDTGKGFWKEEYTYDPNGNIVQKRNGWGSIDYQYNQGNQLLQAGNRTYQYDPEGNLVKEILGGNEIIYRYDNENRLIRANHKYENFLSGREYAGKITYSYDALGRRVKKESAPVEGPENEVEYYIYNGLGLDILAEYHDDYKSNGKPNPAGNPNRIIEYYYGNGMMLASRNIKDPSQRRWDKDPVKDVAFYHQDVLGSVVLITGKDGHVDERNQYDIWGKVYDGKLEDNLPGSGRKNNVYGFTGQRYQPELGIYSFAFRDYNPRAMRWMMEDPIKDGTNWYQYCYSNPVNFVDPLGLDVNEGDAKDFWETRKESWSYPLESKATEDPASSDNYFGSNRDSGSRKHAGIDFHASPGTDVVAMTDGTVVEVTKNYYSGTDAVTIKNNDGTIVRYCEISVSVKKDDTITQGQVIGEVKLNQDKNPQSMLHLEIYMGTKTGSLSDKNNKTYDYVPDKTFNRRGDLIDPTGAKDLEIYDKNEAEKKTTSTEGKKP